MQPPSNLPPNQPYQPATPPPRGDTGLKITLIVIGFITLLLITAAIFFAIFVANSLKSDAESDESSKVHDSKNLAEVNALVASKSYFSMYFPEITCGPNDSLYATNYHKWNQAWITCLDSAWEPVVDDYGGTYSKLSGVVSIKSTKEAKDCERDDSSSQKVAAFYCRANETIYILGPVGSIEEDLSILFHEFSHHLAMNFYVTLDSDVLTEFMYNDHPSQPISRKAALRLQHDRSENSAECSSLAMMSTAGRLKSTAGQQWLTSFNNPSNEYIEAGYGSSTLRQRYAGVTTATPPLMESCNTWKWSDADFATAK